MTSHRTYSAALPPPGWVSLPAIQLHETGVVHLFEPNARDPQKLIRQLLDGVYPRPFVLDNGHTRRLHFSLKLVQSEMDVRAPEKLVLGYTRHMMGFLLLNQNPKHIVIVGLGGGSLTKFCYRRLPRCRVTTVEANEDVVVCGPWFLLPAADERMQLITADAADYFAEERDGADAVLLDAYDEDGLAPRLCSAEFYADVRRHLKPNGVLVANIVGQGLVAETHLDLIRDTFGDRVACANIPADGNRIVFAFNNLDHPPAWSSLDRIAKMLDGKLDLDLTKLVTELGRNAQRKARKTRRPA